MKLKALLFSMIILLGAATTASAHQPEDWFPQEFPAEVFVYPNPSNGVFFIELQSNDFMQVELKVVSLIGKTIKQETLEPNTRVQLDLTDQPKGVYFVQLTAGNEKYLKRVIIQ